MHELDVNAMAKTRPITGRMGCSKWFNSPRQYFTSQQHIQRNKLHRKLYGLHPLTKTIAALLYIKRSCNNNYFIEVNKSSFTLNPFGVIVLFVGVGVGIFSFILHTQEINHWYIISP